MCHAMGARREVTPFVNDGYVTIGYECPECGKTVHKCLRWRVVCNLILGAGVTFRCQGCGKDVEVRGLEVRDVR